MSYFLKQKPTLSGFFNVSTRCPDPRQLLRSRGSNYDTIIAHILAPSVIADKCCQKSDRIG
jgi:hypothetical protein